jgi:hypothetical protein
MRAVLAIAIALGVTAATSPADGQHSPEAQAKLDKLLEGKIEGRTRRCLPVRQVIHPIAIDEATLAFVDGPRIWLNHVTASFECGKLDKMSDVAFEGAANQVCSGNTLYFTSGTLQGACALSEFVPYQKP